MARVFKIHFACQGPVTLPGELICGLTLIETCVVSIVELLIEEKSNQQVKFKFVIYHVEAHVYKHCFFVSPWFILFCIICGMCKMAKQIN